MKLRQQAVYKVWTASTDHYRFTTSHGGFGLSSPHHTHWRGRTEPLGGCNNTNTDSPRRRGRAALCWWTHNAGTKCQLR